MGPNSEALVKQDVAASAKGWLHTTALAKRFADNTLLCLCVQICTYIHIILSLACVSGWVCVLVCRPESLGNRWRFRRSNISDAGVELHLWGGTALAAWVWLQDWCNGTSLFPNIPLHLSAVLSVLHKHSRFAQNLKMKVQKKKSLGTFGNGFLLFDDSLSCEKLSGHID